MSVHISVSPVGKRRVDYESTPTERVQTGS